MTLVSVSNTTESKIVKDDYSLSISSDRVKLVGTVSTAGGGIDFDLELIQTVGTGAFIFFALPYPLGEYIAWGGIGQPLTVEADPLGTKYTYDNSIDYSEYVGGYIMHGGVWDVILSGSAGVLVTARVYVPDDNPQIVFSPWYFYDNTWVAVSPSEFSIVGASLGAASKFVNKRQIAGAKLPSWVYNACGLSYDVDDDINDVIAQNNINAPLMMLVFSETAPVAINEFQWCIGDSAVNNNLAGVYIGRPFRVVGINSSCTYGVLDGLITEIGLMGMVDPLGRFDTDGVNKHTFILDGVSRNQTRTVSVDFAGDELLNLKTLGVIGSQSRVSITLIVELL